MDAILSREAIRVGPALAVLLLASAGAAPPGTAQVRLELDARADSDVQGGAPEVNYGTDPFIHVGNPDKTVFVWFDLSAVPAGATIRRAELVMTTAGTATGSNDVEVGAVQERWGELRVTYGNQPEIAWRGRLGPVTGAGPVVWDVRPLVERWVSGNQENHGLALRGNGPIWAFHARESPHPGARPQLRLEYDPPCP